MKYYILQLGEIAAENTLHQFDDNARRREKTIELIFGEKLLDMDQAEAWAKYLHELEDNGRITFEGDPGLEWFTATPATV